MSKHQLSCFWSMCFSYCDKVTCLLHSLSLFTPEIMASSLSPINSKWNKEEAILLCLKENKLFLLNIIFWCTLLVVWLTIRMNKFLFQHCESIERMPEGEGEVFSIFWKHNTLYNCSSDMHGFDSLRVHVLYMEIQPPVLVATCCVNDSYKHIVYPRFS